MWTPIDANVKKDNYADSNKYSVKEYQTLIGKLIFLNVNTRANISYTLGYSWVRR